MSQESFPILNPVVYLNYLDQRAGSDYEVTRDVSGYPWCTLRSGDSSILLSDVHW